MTTDNRYAISAEQQADYYPVAQVSPAMTRLPFIAAAATLIVVAALHFIKSEMEPSWHMVSEYAIGDYGWIMKLGFFCWAISCISLVATIRSQIKSTGGKIGLILLFIAGIAIIMAGIFVMDSPTASKEQLTTHGHLHGLASMIGLPGQPIAALLISRSLARHPAWAAAKKSIVLTAHFSWISLVVMIACTVIMLGKTEGKFGPDTLIGWPNRLLVIAYCAWLMTVAWHARRIYCKQAALQR